MEALSFWLFCSIVAICITYYNVQALKYEAMEDKYNEQESEQE